MFWRRDDCYWNMGVVNTVITATAEKGAPQGTHTTATCHYQLCINVFCQFTDHFSRIAVFFLVKRERHLKTETRLFANV